MDVISILRKKRQEVSGLEVEVRGSRVEEHPRVYDGIEVVYRVRGREVAPKAVERAIELSETRYCPAIAMIGEVTELTNRYEIEEEVQMKHIDEITPGMPNASQPLEDVATAG